MSAREKELLAYVHKQVKAFVHKELESRRKKVQDDPLLNKEAEETENINLYIARLGEALRLLRMDKVLSEGTILHEEVAKLVRSKEVKKGLLPQETLKLSKEKLLEFYQVAFTFFEGEYYQEASNLYLFLTFLNPHVSSFWVGLGMTEEMQEHYDSAIGAYLTALDLNENDLQPVLYCAECLNKMNKPKKAKELLQFAMRQLRDVPSYQEFKKQAQRWM
jgi:type III secretion system low calcium response chaperone LcrH/SycD